MKVYQTNEIKNIALIGGAKSGKTTLAECMLFEGGIINRRGSVEDKNTVSDYREIELERQNSIYSSVLYTEVFDKKINIIDTPGFDDFVGEVLGALKVADTAIMLVNAQNGVEVGTEITWRHTNKCNSPVIFAVNQLEHEKANFDETIRQMKSLFGEKVTIIQYPVNIGHSFNTIIDVLKMKMLKFPTGGGKIEISDVPENEKAKAEELHTKLIEAAAESEEALMEIFFDKGTLTEEELFKGLKKGIVSRDLFPVLCVCAKHNMGVSTLLEFISNNAPSANDVLPQKSTEGKAIKVDDKGPVIAFVFKTAVEPHIGQVSFFKMLSGILSEGTDLVNSNTNSKERLTQFFVTAGKTRTKIEKIFAGDIACTIKLKDTHTNNTLLMPKDQSNLMVEPIKYPEPKFRTAVKAKNTADDEKLITIFREMHEVDQTILYEQSKELKQIILQGQGELHLNIAKWIVENLQKIEIEYFAPKIPYRETITKTAKSVYRHKKQSGGAGQFGEVHIVIEPFTEGMPNPTKYKFGTKEINISVRPAYNGFYLLFKTHLI